MAKAAQPFCHNMWTTVVFGQHSLPIKVSYGANPCKGRYKYIHPSNYQKRGGISRVELPSLEGPSAEWIWGSPTSSPSNAASPNKIITNRAPTRTLDITGHAANFLVPTPFLRHHHRRHFTGFKGPSVQGGFLSSVRIFLRH